jgi:ribonuclease VapC
VAADEPGYVLDSFALLAYFQGETTEPIVRSLLAEAQVGTHAVYLSIINLGELLYIVERERGLVAAQRALAAVDQLPIHIVPASRANALAAAHLKAAYPVAYADAFAAAAAQEHGATLVTGDPEFEVLARANVVKVWWLAREGWSVERKCGTTNDGIRRKEGGGTKDGRLAGRK